MQRSAIAGELPRLVTTDRVAGFDLLRGLCALAVAFFHSGHEWGSVAAPETFGTYAVYLFFVLSGASMWIAYAQRFAGGFSFGRFLALRFIRLAPLYALTVVCTAALAVVEHNYNLQQFRKGLLNVAFAFGLGNPGGTSVVAGGWSLGIEFVFYLLFPVFLSAMRSRWWAWFVAGAFVAQHLFIATVLPAGASLATNWSAYTQFLAFVFYFASGCAIGRGLSAGRLPGIGWGTMLACLLAIGLAGGATAEEGLTGTRGMLLSLLAAAAVMASANLHAGPAFDRVAGLLGRASYGVYILHPWVFTVMSLVNRRTGIGDVAVAVLTTVLSVPLALAIHQWVELPAQRLLKRRLNPAAGARVAS